MMMGRVRFKDAFGVTFRPWSVVNRIAHGLNSVIFRSPTLTSFISQPQLDSQHPWRLIYLRNISTFLSPQLILPFTVRNGTKGGSYGLSAVLQAQSFLFSAFMLS